eukprot:m.58797 g.58797  ORF g.58797 m.58797 type:complete len:172 (-) comp13176_c1_seq2:138-653(-)
MTMYRFLFQLARLRLLLMLAVCLSEQVAALSRGSDKRELAEKLGASVYIDTSAQDPVQELRKLGGAALIVCTAFDSKAMSSLAGGLGKSGTLLILGADAAPLEVSPFSIIGNRGRIQGWPSGAPIDSEDTLNFAAEQGVRTMVEIYPLSQASEAFERMLSNKARFRVVLKP